MRKLLNKFRASWIGVILGAVIAVFPQALKELAEKPANPWLPQPLAAAFENYPILSVLCEFWAILVAIGCLVLDKLCSTAGDNFPDARTLIGVIVQLANTVGMKSAYLHCKAVQKLGETPTTLHTSSPDAQIKTHLTGVWQIFNLEARENGLDENKVVKVTLAEMDQNGRFHTFRAFYPMNLQPQVPQSFYGKNTGFAEAARTRQVLVMHDLGKEAKRLKRYVPSTSQDSGSMICFPIEVQPLTGRPTVPFVLSIKCDEPKAFKISKRERYIFLIQQFADRIRLEYYNEILEGDQE